MSDVAGFASLTDHDHPQTLEEIMQDTDYLELEGNMVGQEVVGGTSGSTQNTPKKTVLNLAIPAGGIDADIGDTLSIKSWDSKGGKSIGSKKSHGSSQDHSKEFGSIMRHVILKAVSSQVCSAMERVHAGSPTCMATTHLIAIGTQNGFVLVFDSSQVIKWFLGGVEIGANYGAVSSLAFNSDSSRLLAGFARGQLIEFDIVSGKILRDLNDVHPAGSAVLHTKYADDHNTAFFADSGGSVFELSMKRGLRGPGATARCIFSGSRGEVCTMEPLRVGGYPAHPLADYSILALATISKVIVITVRPKLKVLMTSPLTGDPHTLPLLCWQFVVIQNPSFNKVVDPVLTFARDQTIHFYQVTVNLSDKIVFIPLQSITVNYRLLSCQWLNTRVMGLLSSTEQFHLLDVRSREQLETIDLTRVELVYQTQFFKGTATGGNVSAALSLAGEMAVYGSTTAFTNQLLVLGARTFHVLIIRSWSERLEHLLKNEKYPAAMQLGTEFYAEPGKGLVGLRGNRERKRNLISLKMVGILRRFLESSMTTNFPTEGGMGTLTKYFNEIVPPCVDLCIKLSQTDHLFDSVWNTFQEDPFSSAVYLECLEPYILSDQLTTIPTNIVQQFVSHYHARNKLEGLEACLTHLSVMCLDIHQVMSVCQQHQLYDAIIHIYNNAMMDYITPTEKLLELMGKALKEDDPLNDGQVKLGNKLLVYISQCLAGRAYPWGDIPKDQVKQVKYDVYSTITLLRSRQIPAEGEEGSTPPPYPHLHTLLQFDTQGFLNVLSIAFEEEEFNTEVGQCQKQRLVDILLEVMVKEDSPFSASQVGYLATFLARQLAKGDKSLAVSRDLFSRVLVMLTEDGSGYGQKEERQQALLDIVQSGERGWDHFNQDDLEVNCQNIGFYKILEKLYERTGQHEKILDCYLLDTGRVQQVFSFLQSMMMNSILPSSTLTLLTGQVMEKLYDLVELDCRKMANLVFQHQLISTIAVLEKLGSNKPLLYQFLTHLLDCKENTSSPSTPVKTITEAEDLPAEELYEGYIELMCQLEPHQVASYLRSRDSYSTARALELCTQFNIMDGRVYLLEREGRIMEAFELLKSGLEGKISGLLAHLENSPDASSSLKWTSLNTNLIVVVTFCQRVSPSFPLNERESLWCPLLDLLVVPLSTLGEKEVVSKWREMVRHVISSMLGYVSHSRVVAAVLADPGYSEGSWAELKQLLGELIDTFRYESQLLESSKTLIEEEKAVLMKKLVATKRKGISNFSLKCSICYNSLGSERALVFSCHHGFHASCLDNGGGVMLSEVGEEVWRCVLCVGAGRRWLAGQGAETAGRRIEHGEKGKGVDEKVTKAREFLKLYDKREDSSQIFDPDKSYIKSDKFHLRLKPAMQ
eukprot:TRINITY_DN18820_c0_g1_i1.p1 TRINITY_DN18820_c0_g1~~TRINITY_DN18820_c0_g1_i1.p1  ORF type:complete len:1423 (-),score=489.80 TRINITY_DN18820_c0_g1_i1:146-4273(-)